MTLIQRVTSNVQAEILGVTTKEERTVPRASRVCAGRASGEERRDVGAANNLFPLAISRLGGPDLVTGLGLGVPFGENGR